MTNMTKVTIWRADNGYIIKAPHPNDDGPIYFTHEVKEDCSVDWQKEEAEALASTLYQVIEALAPTEMRSRYAPHRVYVRIEPGDKYEPCEDNEPGVHSEPDPK
jgi:hypothetical protein